MNRRNFLRGSLSLLGSALGTVAFGQMMHGNSKGHMDHGKMGHQGMDHGNMNHGNMNHGDMGMMGENMGVPPMVKEGYQLGDWHLTTADIEVMRQSNQHLMALDQFPKGNSLPVVPTLINESNEAGVFKGTLRAEVVKTSLVDGTETTIWGYNGMTPGPTIELYEGDWVELRVINQLPEETTVHWHGLLVPPSEDGNPQEAIPAGCERTYRFRIPEESAGIYWYHPHGHGTVAPQVFKGLAGALIVRSRNDLFAQYPEKNLFISDLKLDANGTISENSFFDWVNGREGQFTLINGAYQPTISINETTRLRIWNACSARYLNLDFGFANCYLIATDGGFIEKPIKLALHLLSPGERIEVMVIPHNEGEQSLINRRYDRDKMGPSMEADPDSALATLNLTGKGTNDLPQKIRQLPKIGKIANQQRVEYTEVMSPKQMLFLVNGKMHDLKRSDLTTQKGAWEEWIIFNNSHMDHNFHIHGTQFRVLEHEVGGIKSKPTIDGLRDTINLKPYETIRLVMQQLDSGLRMFHCHILEHETLGMMAQLEIR